MRKMLEELPDVLGRGRPSKATIDRLQLVVEGIEKGLPYDTACAIAGICYQTFRNWIKQGEQEESGIFFDFLESVKKAEANSEQNHIDNITQAGGEGMWQASAWMLERRYPRKWGKQERHEFTGANGGPILFSWKQLIEEAETDDIKQIEE